MHIIRHLLSQLLYYHRRLYIVLGNALRADLRDAALQHGRPKGHDYFQSV